MVLEKDGEDQLDKSCDKKESNIVYRIKKKKVTSSSGTVF